MPFLAIFRKDKDKDASRSKTPIPPSPVPASTASRKSSTFSRTRPSFTSSRSCVSPPPARVASSPPPQLANISPHSDFDYVLPDLDAPSLMGVSPAPEPEKELVQVPEERPISPKPRRALAFGRRRGSASSGVVIASASPTPRPFSEALDAFMSRKQQQDTDRDRDPDRPTLEAQPTQAPPLPSPESITSKNVNSATTTPTPNTRTVATTALELDSDDDPLVPPPTRASVFGGYAYSDRGRSQSSVPDVDRDSNESDMVRSESGHSRPPRTQVHPHQLARGKNKSVDLDSLLVAPSAPAPTAGSSAASDSGAPVKTKQKDASTKSGGLFGWRSKSSKEVPAAAAPTPIVTADPADSSFSLKSFRHVGPASIPSSPVAQPGPALGSSTNVNTVGTNNTSTPAAIVGTPPSSYGRASPAPGMRPIPGRTGTSRERVNSTGSEGVMTAGLFRQAARRSNTNLVEEASTSPRSSVFRDREKRGPPTRAWDMRDKDDASSGSEPAPVRPSRTTRLPEGATSDRSELGVGGKPRGIGRSSSAMPYVGSGESSPESPFTSALSKLGEESPLARSGLEGGATGNVRFAARSDGGFRSVSAAATPASRPGPQPAQPRPGIGAINVRPEMRGVNARTMTQGSGLPQSVRPSPRSTNSPPGPQPASQSSIPRPSPPTTSRPGPPSARSNSPTKPRQSAPTTMGRSPVRTTIPTKTNDGPSIKPRASSPIKMSGRPPSPAVSTKSNRSARSIPGSPTRSVPGSPTKTISGSPIKSSLRRPSVDTTTSSHSRYASVDTYRAKSPATDMHRAKSPSVDVSRAKSPAPSVPRVTDMSRAKSPGPAISTSRTGYVPPPRQSSLARAGMDLDSDEDESEPEAESEDDGFGTRPVEKKVAEEKARVGGSNTFGARVAGTPEVGALRGRASPFVSRQGSGSNNGHEGLTRERTITQRTAGSGRTSPARDEQPPKPPPKVGVSLFDRPTPSCDKSSSSSLSSSPFDKFGTPPVAPGRSSARGRASHSTSAISAAATARNSAAIAEANRRLGHNRGAPSASGTSGRPSHIRAPAEGTDTDEDEDDKSETDSEDNAPLSVLSAPRRPGSAASNAPSMARSLARTQKPLVDLSGPNGAPPPRPPRRVPGVGVTRNSSLRGSRSVEDLGRMTMAPGSVVGARPGPRPFVASPPSSTGDSSSGKAPLTPRDGSEAGGRRIGSALGPAGEEARRKERRRGEAKASVELGNVINGPGPLDDEDGDMAHPQMGGMGMMWGQPGLFPQMTGFQSMPFGGSFPASQSMPFIPPPPPPGASEQYVVAHQQAMMMAKQAYLSTVAQQAMAFATEQWERSSNAGGSVYGGSQMGGMMGMPMIGMYANSAYAASAYEGSVSGGGWGSTSAYGGGRSVYGGGAGAKSEYGGGMRGSPTKSAVRGPGQSRLRAATATADMPAPANRGNPVPPSTWTTRRKGGPA